MVAVYPLLSQINNPQDLKRLDVEALSGLCQEIRSLITDVVSRNGGHLASNLGVVELTVALHRVFDSPVDKLIWDVGHQCYTHKILTDRKNRFHSLRLCGGVSGFPRREESPHDIANTGHSSTSISTAVGLVVGDSLRERRGKVVAVIGDGALTGGMAWEGLNHAGHLGKSVIIVLNDNKMSIAKNVGAFSSYLSRLTATVLYQSFRKRVDRAVVGIPVFGERLLDFIYRLKKGFKALIFRESIFSHLGFEYVGPIDGHNVELLEKVFRNVRRLEKPVVVHVVTQKGKGYEPAEGDPTLYHGVSAFSIQDGETPSHEVPRATPLSTSVPTTFTQAFSRAIVGAAAADTRIVAVSAAMTHGTGLSPFQSLYPRRIFDTGITEQHAVTFAAGLALSGLRPVVTVYSTFVQRAVDQVIHDVALPRLPVVFAVDRCGVVGGDGQTHQGVFDVALFRGIPGLTLLSPASAGEVDVLLRYALALDTPAMIRYPKATCFPECEALSEPAETGRGVLVVEREGSRVLFVCLGGVLSEVCDASNLLSTKGIDSDVYNLRFIKPIDAPHLMAFMQAYSTVIVVEDGVLLGGIGERIVCLCREFDMRVDVHTIGVADSFVPHGTRSDSLRFCGLDASSLAEAVEAATVGHGSPKAVSELTMR